MYKGKICCKKCDLLMTDLENLKLSPAGDCVSPAQNQLQEE